MSVVGIKYCIHVLYGERSRFTKETILLPYVAAADPTHRKEISFPPSESCTPRRRFHPLVFADLVHFTSPHIAPLYSHPVQHDSSRNGCFIRALRTTYHWRFTRTYQLPPALSLHLQFCQNKPGINPVSLCSLSVSERRSDTENLNSITYIWFVARTVLLCSHAILLLNCYTSTLSDRALFSCASSEPCCHYYGSQD